MYLLINLSYSESILIGVLSGLFSGILLTFILYIIRTKLNLPDKLLIFNEEKKVRFIISNSSHLFKLINIYAELSLIKPNDNFENEIKVKPITLVKSKTLLVNRKKFFCKESKKNQYIFSTRKDIDFSNILSYSELGYTKVRLRLSVTNSFTNFTKVYERYFCKNDFKEFQKFETIK